MKKIILFLTILFLSVLNINALTLSNGTTYPDLPNNEQNFVIFKSDDNKIYAGIIPIDWKVTTDNSDIYINSEITYRLNSNNTWGNTGNDYSKSITEIIATNVNIYNNSNEIIYNAGYGINSSEEPVEPETPDETKQTDIGVINDIAHIINETMIKLNENGIEFWQIMIGLIIFNFIIFLICYIATHFSF